MGDDSNNGVITDKAIFDALKFKLVKTNAVSIQTMDNGDSAVSMLASDDYKRSHGQTADATTMNTALLQKLEGIHLPDSLPAGTMDETTASVIKKVLIAKSADDQHAVEAIAQARVNYNTLGITPEQKDAMTRAIDHAGMGSELAALTGDSHHKSEKFIELYQKSHGGDGEVLKTGGFLGFGVSTTVIHDPKVSLLKVTGKMDNDTVRAVLADDKAFPASHQDTALGVIERDAGSTAQHVVDSAGKALAAAKHEGQQLTRSLHLSSPGIASAATLASPAKADLADPENIKQIQKELANLGFKENFSVYKADGIIGKATTDDLNAFAAQYEQHNHKDAQGKAIHLSGALDANMVQALSQAELAMKTGNESRLASNVGESTTTNLTLPKTTRIVRSIGQ